MVRVTAHQKCDGSCCWRDRYRFISIWGDDFPPSDRPTVEQVVVPESPRVVTCTFPFPLYGDPLRYPFDRSALALGVAMDRHYPDRREERLTHAQVEAYITILVSTCVPRIHLAALANPTAADPATQTAARQQPYLLVDIFRFERPLYFTILTICLVLLVTAAAYAVFLRPLDQLIINAGALILGVWGIRVILLGTTLPGLTAVDLGLWSVILFLMATITIRTLWLLEESSGWHLLRTIVRYRPAADPPA